MSLCASWGAQNSTSVPEIAGSAIAGSAVSCEIEAMANYATWGLVKCPINVLLEVWHMAMGMGPRTNAKPAVAVTGLGSGNRDSRRGGCIFGRGKPGADRPILEVRLLCMNRSCSQCHQHDGHTKLPSNHIAYLVKTDNYSFCRLYDGYALGKSVDSD